MSKSILNLKALNEIYSHVKTYAESKNISDIEFQLKFKDEDCLLEINYKVDFYLYNQQMPIDVHVEYELDDVIRDLKLEVDKLKKRL